MSTGDLKNNLRKLQAEVKGLKYDKELDMDGLSRGIASAFLPIYHYAFVDYSRYMAAQLTEHSLELYGKTDKRFMDTVYKALRELFAYKPPITKDQFFSNGFVERKVIMCTEILQHVRQRHQSLAPAKSSSKPRTAAMAQAKPTVRVESASQSALSEKGSSHQIPAKDTGTGPTRSGSAGSTINPTRSGSAGSTINPRSSPQERLAENCVPAVQVVNEVRRAVDSTQKEEATSASIRLDATSMPPPSTTHVMRPKARFPGSTEGLYNPLAYSERTVVGLRTDDAFDNPGLPITVTSRGEESSDIVPGQLSPCVEVINIDRDSARQHDLAAFPGSPQLRPIDTVPKTPVHPPYHNSYGNLRRDARSVSPVATNMTNEGLEKLQGVLQSLEERLGSIEALMNKRVDADSEKNAQSETVLARITLLESKMSMLESQISRIAGVVTVPGGIVQGVENCSPIPSGQVAGDISNAHFSRGSESAELSAGVNQRLRVTASTPMEPEPSHEKQDVPEKSKDPSMDQARRITSMLKETENLLNIQVHSPVKTPASK